MDKLENFGGKTLLGRSGQPAELASMYVELATARRELRDGPI